MTKNSEFSCGVLRPDSLMVAISQVTDREIIASKIFYIDNRVTEIDLQNALHISIYQENNRIRDIFYIDATGSVSFCWLSASSVEPIILVFPEINSRQLLYNMSRIFVDIFSAYNFYFQTCISLCTELDAVTAGHRLDWIQHWLSVIFPNATAEEIVFAAQGVHKTEEPTKANSH